MLRIAVLLILSTVTPWAASAATQPIYINNSPVTCPPDPPPVIDATAFANRAPFHIDGIFLSGLPFQTANTRYFTNASSGVMSGNPGFRFDYSSGNTRSPMSNWLNQGSISGDTFLLVLSDNITTTGPLNCGDGGLIRLKGGDINVSRNGLRAGGGFTNLITGGNLSDTNYIDPTGVTDLYWATGTNNVLTGNGTLTPLPGAFTLPFPSTPTHRVTDPRFLPTTTTESFFVQNANAFVYQATTSPTSRVVQVVFAPTNSFFDSNISTRVFFTPDADDGVTAVIEIKYPEYDVVSQQYTTNFLYFSDSTAFATNLALANNFSAPTRRPNSYELIRYSSSTGTPLISPFLEIQTNATFSPAMLYNPSFASNSVSVRYAAYGAQLDAISVLNGSGQNVAASTDPTNYPGRVEITGNTVNLDLARIGAASTVIIKANDLASNKVAKIAAPFENLDLRTSQPEMVISNFAPNTIQRLTGQLQAYSCIWRNSERLGNTTNTVDFHVLMLQHFLNSSLPITINELALHAPRLVIGDPLTVRKSMLLDTRNLEVTGGLALPFGANWSNTNIVEVYTLTNRGVINVSGAAVVGTDRANPYDYYFNIGTNTASSHDIRTRVFDNRGCLVASAGVIAVDATTAMIAGAPLVTNLVFVPVLTPFGGIFTLQQTQSVVGAKIQANADVHITADQMVLSNAVVDTGASGGALFLSAASGLTDGGTNGVSYINVSGGFNLLTHPTTSSLLNTRITTRTARNSESFHTWSARDHGPNAEGFVNNSVVGKLTIDAGEFSLVHFAGPNGENGKAMYVDYLELLNYAESNYNAQLAIDPSITIYYANCNLSPSKLDGAVNGRLRWVAGFAGPLSSTNITYPDGTVYTVNIAVATDLDLDSDRDKILNNNDPTPIYTASSVGLEVTRSNSQPAQVLITWNAFPGVDNTVQYCHSFVQPQWTTLTTVRPPGVLTAPYTVTDVANTPGRIYRVIVNVPPY